jgi:hypothetical protein
MRAGRSSRRNSELERRRGCGPDVAGLTRTAALPALTLRGVRMWAHAGVLRHPCPADNKVHRDHPTLGYIVRQLRMHPERATRLIRSSIERLSTARVKVKVHDVDNTAVGGTATTGGEVTVGFLANFGPREQKDIAAKRDNYKQLDQAMADLIRGGERG